MEETVEETGYRGRTMELRVVNSDKGNQFLGIEELVVTAIGQMSREKLGHFLLRLFSWDESINAFKLMLENDCGSDENGNNADVLRKVCLEHSSEAVKVLLTNALEDAGKERQRTEDLKKHIEKMEQAWPEPYKKYMPKKDYFYAGYIDCEEQAQKMLDEVQS